MFIFEGDSADQVWEGAASAFESESSSRDQSGRDGDTREILHAVFSIRYPRQRWVLTRQPSINPAFAIAEVVWILRGREDSAFLNFWNPKLPRFSGTGPKYDGAYGYRLRHQFKIDQLDRAYSALRAAPDSRQVVLQMWDPRTDLPDITGAPASMDVPCNVCSLLKIRDRRLEWTQILRSNDLFLGVPYNFVQFTSLQEVLAGWLGLQPGGYVQFSDSLHVYHRDLPQLRQLRKRVAVRNEDSLALPKTESDEVFAQLETDMLALMNECLTPTELEKIASRTRPQAYRNFALILAAYAAKRKGWTASVREVLTECSNPVLKQLSWKWVQSPALATS